MKDLIFIGAGGHALDITDIVKDINSETIEKDSKYNIVGYLSDDPDYFNNKFDILGAISDIPLLSKVMGPYTQYVIAINDSKKREEIWNTYFNYELENHSPWRGAKLIHPSAEPKYNIEGLVGYKADTVVGPMSYVARGTRFGLGIHINSGVTINQGCRIGNFGTISPGVNICGDVTIGERVQFGAGGVVINYKKIGDDVTVGSGSVVISDVPDNSTVVGVPAKPIKTNGQIVWG